jgi:hypothetical protein
MPTAAAGSSSSISKTKYRFSYATNVFASDKFTNTEQYFCFLAAFLLRRVCHADLAALFKYATLRIPDRRAQSRWTANHNNAYSSKAFDILCFIRPHIMQCLRL